MFIYCGHKSRHRTPFSPKQYFLTDSNDPTKNYATLLAVNEICLYCVPFSYEKVFMREMKFGLNWTLHWTCKQALRHEDVWWTGSTPQYHSHLTSALRKKRPALRPERFNPGDRHPGTHWTGSWDSPVWRLWRRENYRPLPGTEHRSSTPQPSHYTELSPLSERNCICETYFNTGQ